jgi:hypothetical protein
MWMSRVHLGMQDERFVGLHVILRSVPGVMAAPGAEALMRCRKHGRRAVAGTLLGLSAVILLSRVALADAPTAIKILPTRAWFERHREAQSETFQGVNLMYLGGPVIRRVRTHAIFWAPRGHPISARYQSLIVRYLKDIGGSDFFNIVTQYYQVTSRSEFIANSSRFDGAWVDTQNPYPRSGKPADPLQDNDIQAEVLRAIAARHWHAGPPDLYFVFTAPRIESCADSMDCTPGARFASYCAYHGSFTENGHGIAYANMPYDGTWRRSCRNFTRSPNHDLAADIEVSILSHEHFEAVTDPTFNPPAWVDASGLEIGDKCAFSYGVIRPDGSNIWLNGHPYILQLEWSNAVTSCATGYGKSSMSEIER